MQKKKKERMEVVIGNKPFSTLFAYEDDHPLHAMEELKDGKCIAFTLLFKPFGEDKLYFYDECFNMILTLGALYRARKIVATNQIRGYEDCLYGKKLFSRVNPVKMVKRGTALRKVTIHTGPVHYQEITDQYSLVELANDKDFKSDAVTKITIE